MNTWASTKADNLQCIQEEETSRMVELRTTVNIIIKAQHLKEIPEDKNRSTWEVAKQTTPI